MKNNIMEVKTVVYIIFLGALLTSFLIHMKITLILVGGILVGVTLFEAANFLSNKLKLSYRIWLGICLLILAGGIGLFMSYLYPKISAQLESFISSFPGLLDKVEASMEKNFGIKSLKSVIPLDGGPQASQVLKSMSKNALSGILLLFGGVTTAISIFFLGLFLAFEPKAYFKGVRFIFPSHMKNVVSSFLRSTEIMLVWWTVGRLSSMAVVGVLTYIGLEFIGIDNALAFGFITALLAFIPFIGPVMSILPPLTVALSQDGSKAALSVIVLYLVIQFVESYAITPLIQRRAASLPPAVGLVSILFFSSVGGLLGTMLAAPIAVILLSLTKEWKGLESQKSL